MSDLMLNMLNHASDEDLMMSRFDCHIKGLHSIVFKNDGGRLTRGFFTTPNHEMHRNYDIQRGKLSVGIHSHRYGLTLFGVSGMALNIQMRHSRFGTEFSAYRYKSKDDIEFIQFDKLTTHSLTPITQSVAVTMDKDEMHTVFVQRGQCASWIVAEGQEENNYTMLYTNESPQCNDFISPKSPDEVREFVRHFYRD